MDAKRVKFAVLVLFFVLLAVLAFFIIRPFIPSLLASFVFAYLFFPVYRFVQRYVQRPAWSALIVTFLVAVIIVLPLLFIANVVIHEALTLYQSDVQRDVTTFISRFIAENAFLTENISSILQKAASYVVTVATDFVIAVPARILDIAVFLYVMFHLFIVGETFFAKVSGAIPLRNKEKFVKHLGDTTYGIMYGLFLVALIEFVIAVIGLSVLGVGAPFLWALLIFIAALLPFIGPSAVLIPIILFKAFQGATLAVIGLVILWIILLYIDMLLRTKIMSDRAKMHPAIMLLGIIGGVGVFGIIGLIIGPLVLSFLTVLIEEYYHEFVRAE